MEDKTMTDDTTQERFPPQFHQGCHCVRRRSVLRHVPVLLVDGARPADVGARRRRTADHAQGQRPGPPRRRAQAGNAGDDAPIQAGADRHQARMRPRRVRRLHGPHRRCAALLVLDPHPPRARRRIVTIEGLAAADGTLHPVQQGVVDEQGFQCAFCSRLRDGRGRLPQDEPEPDAAGAGARRLGQSVPLPGLRQDPHRADARRREHAEADHGEQTDRPELHDAGSRREGHGQGQVRRGLARRRHAVRKLLLSPHAARPRERIDTARRWRCPASKPSSPRRSCPPRRTSSTTSGNESLPTPRARGRSPTSRCTRASRISRSPRSTR